MERLSSFVKEENERVYAPLGLVLVDPLKRGLRVVCDAPFIERYINF